MINDVLSFFNFVSWRAAYIKSRGKNEKKVKFMCQGRVTEYKFLNFFLIRAIYNKQTEY